jgi:hypothetical protein
MLLTHLFMCVFVLLFFSATTQSQKMDDFIEIARKRAVQGRHFVYNDRLRIVVGVTRRESELPAIPWINVFAVDNRTQTTLLFGFETYGSSGRRKSRVGDAGLIDFTRDNYLRSC